MTPEQQEQFVLLLVSHQPRLRALIRVLMPWSTDLDDVLQETNLVLWRKADRFEPGTNFWAWAGQVARFEVLTHIRRSKRAPATFSEDVVDRLAEEANRQLAEIEDRREALDQCLEGLPDEHRRIVDLRYRMARSCEAIAESLGRTHGSIRSTLTRIRRQLQDCVRRRIAAEEHP